MLQVDSDINNDNHGRINYEVDDELTEATETLSSSSAPCGQKRKES